MQILFANKYELSTYSKDLICVKDGDRTLVSYNNLTGALKWLDKNVNKGIKNRVEEVLIDFSNIDMGKYPNSFKTENYKVEFDGKKEFNITDLSNRNNVRWIYNKRKMIEKIYHLEINRLKASDFDSLIEGIKELNNRFNMFIMEVR